MFSGWIQNVFQWLRREDAKRLFLKPNNSYENSALQDKTGHFAGMNVPFFFFHKHGRKPHFSPPRPSRATIINLFLSLSLKKRKKRKRFFEGRGMSRCQALRGRERFAKWPLGDKGGKLFFVFSHGLCCCIAPPTEEKWDLFFLRCCREFVLHASSRKRAFFFCRKQEHTLFNDLRCGDETIVTKLSGKSPYYLNSITSAGSHPEENSWNQSQAERNWFRIPPQSEFKKPKYCTVDRQLSNCYLPQQQEQQLSQFYDLSASPQQKIEMPFLHARGP